MEKIKSYNGIVNVVKPPGMSSSGVVVFLKKLLHFKKIGHAGTLDPGAAGVLCVLLGRSARLSDLLMEQKKSYIAQITFGKQTDTLDSYGKLTAEENCDISQEMLKSALEAFKGEIMQVPPAYSAVKIDGQASYKLARKNGGLAPQKPPRRAVIYDISLIEQTGKNKFLIFVECSKGTYIRVLAKDIGSFLKVPAYMSFLLRTGAAGLDIKDSYTVDELKQMKENGDESFIKPPESALKNMKSITVKEITAKRLKDGLSQRVNVDIDGPFKVFSGDGLIGIAEKCEEGIKLKISLY